MRIKAESFAKVGMHGLQAQWVLVRGRERQGENAEDIVRGVQLQSREDDVVRDRAKKSLKHVLE